MLAVSPLLKAQDVPKPVTFNKLSVDAAFGVTKPMAPFSPQSQKRIIDIGHFDLNGRYMLSHAFGIQFGFGLDNLKSSKDAVPGKEFKTKYVRTSLQLVGNLGKAFSMYEWNPKIGLLMHIGAGFSTLNPDKINYIGKDKMLHGIAGLTPQFKVSEKLAIQLDASVMFHLLQTHTFDFASQANLGGFDGYMLTASVGAVYYLGKSVQHADWYVPKPPTFDSKPLEDKIKKIEEDMLDGDADGVANWLDLEPNTPAGATVNTKGQQQFEKVKTDDDDDSDDSDEDVGTLDNKKKLFFTVQLGVYSNPVPSEVMKNITPLDTKTMPDGKIRYFSGVFHSVAEANAKLEEARKAGITDAFITSYYKGSRITVAEANAFLLEKGEKILQPKP